MNRPLQALDQIIRVQFKYILDVTFALQHACKTADMSMPYFKLAELLYSLADELYELDLICGQTHYSKTTHRMFSYSSVLVELLRGNQTNVHPRTLGTLLGPLLNELTTAELLFTNADSNRKATQAANSKPKVVNQENDECKLTEPLPDQEPPSRERLMITTPPENIFELVEASLTGTQDDIWEKYQACLPADLTQEEVKFEYDSFMVMLEEHFI